MSVYVCMYIMPNHELFFHMHVCVCVCVGSQVTAVGDGPVSCGTWLAFRLLCLSHYQVEAKHLLKAFTWLHTHTHTLKQLLVVFLSSHSVF